MYKIILIIIFTVCYTNNLNYQLLDILYNDEDWVLDETLADKSSVYTKNIDNINLKAIRISRDIAIEPANILNVIKNVKNYNTVLINSTNVVTTPIPSKDNIIAKQYISIPIFTDLYFFFHEFQ